MAPARSKPHQRSFGIEGEHLAICRRPSEGGGANEWERTRPLRPRLGGDHRRKPDWIMRSGRLAFTKCETDSNSYQHLETEEPQPGLRNVLLYRYQRGDPVINITSPYDETVFLKPS